jgi:hypothetical protein
MTKKTKDEKKRKTDASLDEKNDRRKKNEKRKTNHES